MVLEFAMRRTYGRDPLYGLLLTFGAALVIEEAIRLVWGSAEQRHARTAGDQRGVPCRGMIYSTYRFFAAAFALAVIVAGLAVP